jgi:hypothetical protein
MTVIPTSIIQATVAARETNASPNLLTAIAGALLLIGGIWGVLNWRNFWSGGSHRRRLERRYGTGTGWPGVAQAVYPYTFVPMLFMGIMIMAGYVMEKSSGRLETMAHLAGTVASVPAIVGSALLVSIALFGWPKSLIPPSARMFRGLCGEWLHRNLSRSKER